MAFYDEHITLPHPYSPPPAVCSLTFPPDAQLLSCEACWVSLDEIVVSEERGRVYVNGCYAHVTLHRLPTGRRSIVRPSPAASSSGRIKNDSPNYSGAVVGRVESRRRRKPKITRKYLGLTVLAMDSAPYEGTYPTQVLAPTRHSLSLSFARSAPVAAVTPSACVNPSSIPSPSPALTPSSPVSPYPSPAVTPSLPCASSTTSPISTLYPFAELAIIDSSPDRVRVTSGMLPSTSTTVASASSTSTVCPLDLTTSVAVEQPMDLQSQARRKRRRLERVVEEESHLAVERLQGSRDDELTQIVFENVMLRRNEIFANSPASSPPPSHKLRCVDSP